MNFLETKNDAAREQNTKRYPPPSDLPKSKYLPPPPPHDNQVHKEKGPNILLKEGSNKKAVRHEKNGHIKQTQRRGNNRPYPQRNYHKTNKKSKYELLKTLVNIKAQKTANTILKA